MAEPLRVLQVVPNMQQGGIENFIMNLYRRIDRERVQFDFLYHYSGDFYFDDEIRSLGGKIYRIPIRDGKVSLMNYRSELASFFSKHTEYRVVHGHMATTAWVYLGAARRAGVSRRIVHAHENSYIRDLRGITRMLLIKQAWRNATDRFACSPEAGRYFFGNRAFDVVPNAIDAKRFLFSGRDRTSFRAKMGIPQDEFLIGHVGRFDKEKNHEFLLEILKRLRDDRVNASLLLVGTGKRLEEIKKRSDDLSVANYVYYAGVMDHPELAYSAMDFFVLPSYFEGFSLVGIEAQCSGLPCLFSSNVSSAASLTDSAIFLSLDAGPGRWAQELVSRRKVRSGCGADALSRASSLGYDIAGCASMMQETYLKMDVTVA